MREIIVGVYIIRNLHTGKVYVGSSNNVLWRFWWHKNQLRKGEHTNEHLQNAWNKYGENAFSFEIACRCTVEQQFKLESELIVKLKAVDRKQGYNKAFPVVQMLPSPAMSEIAKTSWKNPKTASNRKKGIKAKWGDQEFRKAKAKDFEKGREAAHARWGDPEFCAEQGAIRSAKWDNPEWRAAREKELKIKTAKAHTPKAKAKRKNSLLVMWADPEFKAKHIDRLRRNAIAMTKARVAKRAAEKQSSNEIV